LKAETLFELGDEQAARNSLKRAAAGHANTSAYAEFPEVLAVGMAQLRLGMLEPSLRTFRSAHRVDATSVDAMKNIAYLLSEHLGKLDEAIVWLGKAIKVQPKNAELLSSLAVLEARTGKHTADARNTVGLALEIDDDVTTLLRAASVYALTKQSPQDLERAIEYTRQALVRNPQWADFIQEDPDFATLHNDERFLELITAAKRWHGD
jgi:tetratricopeptide (TPR) repeat protein